MKVISAFIVGLLFLSFVGCSTDEPDTNAEQITSVDDEFNFFIESKREALVENLETYRDDLHNLVDALAKDIIDQLNVEHIHVEAIDIVQSTKKVEVVMADAPANVWTAEVTSEITSVKAIGEGIIKVIESEEFTKESQGLFLIDIDEVTGSLERIEKHLERLYLD